MGTISEAPVRRVIREALCQQMTGLDRWSRYRLERKGMFPRRFRIGQRASGWFLDEVSAWQEARAADRNKSNDNQQ